MARIVLNEDASGNHGIVEAFDGSTKVGELEWGKSTAYPGKYFVISVGVAPSHRRTGVATAMYLEWINSKGIGKKDLAPTHKSKEGKAFRKSLDKILPNPVEMTMKFSELVRLAAADAKTEKWGSKAFIGSVFKTYQRQGGTLGWKEFADQLQACHRGGSLVLSRADLIRAMPAKLVIESEVQGPYDVFHFVEIPRNNPTFRRNPATTMDWTKLKEIANSFLQWFGVKALGGKDVLVWMKADGTPALAIQGDAKTIEARSLGMELRPVNNRGYRADYELQKLMGLSPKIDFEGHRASGLSSDVGQTMSDDLLFLDEVVEGVPTILAAAFGTERMPHFTLMPMQGAPYEGRLTEYYSAKRKKVLQGGPPKGAIQTKEHGAGVDFCTVAPSLLETVGGVVGTLDGTDRILLSHSFDTRDRDLKALAKRLNECGGLLYPSLALADCPATNFGNCTLYAHLGVALKTIKPYAAPRSSYPATLYNTDAWTEVTRNFEGSDSAELYQQLTGQWEPASRGHMMVLGPEMKEYASPGYDVKVIKNIPNLRTAIKRKRSVWKRGMTPQQFTEAADSLSDLRYPFLEVKVNGTLDMQSFPVATCPMDAKKSVSEFLKSIGFRGDLLVVEDKREEPGISFEQWQHGWRARDAVIAWQEAQDKKIQMWYELWLEHIADSSSSMSKPRLP